LRTIPATTPPTPASTALSPKASIASEALPRRMKKTTSRMTPTPSKPASGGAFAVHILGEGGGVLRLRRIRFAPRARHLRFRSEAFLRVDRAQRSPDPLHRAPRFRVAFEDGEVVVPRGGRMGSRERRVARRTRRVPGRARRTYFGLRKTARFKPVS
jgi:hypothetical protein